MGQDWIQVAMLVATIMLVLASVGGFTINYYLLRSHVDPEVVVYTAHDDRRPSILIIVIENVGATPAFNVRFKFRREIELEAGEQSGETDGRQLETDAGGAVGRWYSAPRPGRSPGTDVGFLHCPSRDIRRCAYTSVDDLREPTEVPLGSD